MKTKGRQYEIDIANYCNDNLDNPYPEVMSAYAAIVSEFGSANGIRHSSSESWKGTGVREPKADLLFEAGNISVKQSGAVQLASGGLNIHYLVLRNVMMKSEIIYQLKMHFSLKNLSVYSTILDQTRCQIYNGLSGPPLPVVRLMLS